jgi:protein-tyrosine-phosphatase
MSSCNATSSDKSSRLVVGAPTALAMIDICGDEDFAADPGLMSRGFQRSYLTAPRRAPGLLTKLAFVLCTIGAALHLLSPTHANEATDKTIVFVCLHGSVKSQMAAAFFNRIAKERGLPYIAVSRGIEVDSSIPESIRNGLSLDGLTLPDAKPRPLTTADTVDAVKVLAFDSVPDDRRGVTEVNYWSDVPPATKNYAAARDVIVHHIDNLISVLTERPGPQETLQGVVTAVDERNGRLVLRSASGVTSDFKVQDGLIFNSINDGDRVEVNVESIAGVKTVVSLRKE